MKKRVSDNVWIPFWIDKWIFGSMRIEFTLEERSVWIDLLALAAKDNGYIRANEETPYPIQQIAGMLIIPEKILSSAIEKFIEKGKIQRYSNGILYVVTWEKYQFSERYKREFKSSKNNIKSAQVSLFVKCPKEFSSMASKSGMVRLSRLMVAQRINRPLLPTEEVHHINGKENDDRIENLMLFANHRDHKQFEHNYDIKPIWDGNAENSALSAKIRLPYQIKAKHIKSKNIIKEKAENTDFDSLFEEFWKGYPKEGRAKKKYCQMKFLVLCKQNKYESFKKTTIGYFNFLEHKDKNEGFKQNPMDCATWLNNWEEDMPRYVKNGESFKYEPRL